MARNGALSGLWMICVVLSFHVEPTIGKDDNHNDDHGKSEHNVMDHEGHGWHHGMAIRSIMGTVEVIGLGKVAIIKESTTYMVTYAPS